MILHDAFEAFLENTVNLNDGRITLLNQRVDAITKFIAADSTFGPLFVDVAPQGSYAHRTIIKPVGNREYDADVLLVLNENPPWTPAQYTSELRRVFNESSRYKGMAHLRSRAIYIDYANEFHVDVVPYVVQRASITNNKTGLAGQGGWQPANPEQFTEWLEGKYRDTKDHLPDALRLLKYLRDHKTTFSIKSVILSILVGGAVNGYRASQPGYYADVATTFTHILEDLAADLPVHAMPVILDPAGSGQDFRDRWDEAGYLNFYKWIQYYAVKAREAVDAAEADSLAAWQQLFSSEFKVPAVTAAVTSASLHPAGESISKFGVHTQLTETVRLVGRVRQSGIYKPYDLPRRGDRVGKLRDIDFRIEQCTVQRPFETYWKVTNSGQEAMAASCPRGEIVLRGESHHETTRYRGSHSVEVFIVKNGVCVATSKQSVIVVDGL